MNKNYTGIEEIFFFSRFDNHGQLIPASRNHFGPLCFGQPQHAISSHWPARNGVRHLLAIDENFSISLMMDQQTDLTLGILGDDKGAPKPAWSLCPFCPDEQRMFFLVTKSARCLCCLLYTSDAADE